MPEPKRPLKVFLCHASADKPAVRDLYNRLTKDSVDAWLDKAKLLPGQDWKLEIEKAVRESDVVVVCLSKQFHLEGFRQREVRWALDQALEKPEGKIFIIPARLEECDSPESLKKWHWVNLFEDDGYNTLMRALHVQANSIGVTLQVKNTLSNLKMKGAIEYQNEPFGLIDSSNYDAKDNKVLSLLFERQNRNYENLRQRPSIILGYRGSGKTSYLQTVYFDKQYDFYLEIKTADVLERISNEVKGSAESVISSEILSDLWEKVLWTYVLSEIRRSSLPFIEQFDVINEYLEIVGIKESDAIDDVLPKLIELFVDVKKTNASNGISEVLQRFNEINFNGAKSEAINNLKKSNKTFVILMDWRLDDFQLDIESIRYSFAGLLKCIGSMNKTKDVVDVRLCLPAELYPKIIEISSNPIKDFKSVLKIEWTVGELVLIGARHLLYFLSLYYPNVIKGKPLLEAINRSEALAFFHIVLPEQITNQSGYQEKTLSYILRHTQLSPRHFLLLLNSIFRETSITENQSPLPVSGDSVVYGVRQVEGLIVKDIFGAFRMIYPTAEETCRRCLPELESRFSIGKLHQVFNRHGKAVFGNDSFIDFQRMLIDIGAIGRVISGNETDIYIKAAFQNTVAHELHIGYDDELCIHPLFAGLYYSGENQAIPVFPFGSNFDEDD